MTLPVLKLPRKVESDPRHSELEKLLTENLRPLWEKSAIQVPQIELLPAFEKTLEEILRFKQLERGLEHITSILASEKKGLVALQRKMGTAPPHRISRLLIVANDGAERFYRECELLLLQHSDRLLCVIVNASCLRLSERLFPDKIVKSLLVSEKEAVSNILFSLVAK